jgi:hypothetical protein
MSNKLPELPDKLLLERERIRQDHIKNNLDNQAKFITSTEKLRLLNEVVIKETAKTCFSFNYPK